jgi:hypothetical protein
MAVFSDKARTVSRVTFVTLLALSCGWLFKVWDRSDILSRDHFEPALSIAAAISALLLTFLGDPALSRDASTDQTSGDRLIRFGVRWTIGRSTLFRRLATRLHWRALGVSVPPSIRTRYLPAFLNSNRSPTWDPDMCHRDRIAKSQIHILETDSRYPPGLTEHLDDLVQSARRSRTMTVARFLQHLYE